MGSDRRGSPEELEPLYGHRSGDTAYPLAINSTLIAHAKILPMGLGYVLCSSLMMVINKLAVQVFPFPGMLMAVQFFSAALAVRLLSLCGQLDVIPLQWSMVRGFWMVPFVFEIAIFTNMKLLQATSVETAIVFRTLVPIITSWADWQFMARALPSSKSAGGLLLVVVGSVGYALSSRGGIRVDAWMWAISYLLVLAFEMVYVKHVLTSLPMSTWTRVYYNNALALAFWPPFLFVGQEYAQVPLAFSILTQSKPLAIVCLSCALGIGISFTGFGFRNLVTSTTFTVIGVMNKVLTVLVSMLFFATDVSPIAGLSLLICIGGGTLYRQSPSLEKQAVLVTEDEVDREAKS